ncbi:hypothetical protein THAOC_24210, partial [Thalassiosira oceanica]
MYSLFLAFAIAAFPHATGFRGDGRVTVVSDRLGRQIRGDCDARCRERLMPLGVSSAVDAPQQNHESLQGVAVFEQWFESAAGAR